MKRKLASLALLYCLYLLMLLIFPPHMDGRHHIYNWHPNEDAAWLIENNLRLDDVITLDAFGNRIVARTGAGAPYPGFTYPGYPEILRIDQTQLLIEGLIGIIICVVLTLLTALFGDASNSWIQRFMMRFRSWKTHHEKVRSTELPQGQ